MPDDDFANAYRVGGSEQSMTCYQRDSVRLGLL